MAERDPSVPSIASRCLDETALQAWPLPLPPTDSDKEDRGRLLIIAGSAEVPGAAMLCAEAALRAGAGKVRIATAASIAVHVGIALAECKVVGLRENARGGFSAAAARAPLEKVLSDNDAVLIGPGMVDEPAVVALVRALLPRLDCDRVILDAFAMSVLIPKSTTRAKGKRDAGTGAPPSKQPFLVLPHAGEMAHLLNIDKADIESNAETHAISAAARWGAIVALKGARTWIATPESGSWCHSGGRVGLAVSGSGDVLAGIIAGLAARGSTLEQAAAWGVAMHAMAGARLEARHGLIGYLPREIAGEIPRLMHLMCVK